MKSTTLVLGLLLSKAAIVTAYDDFNSSLEARLLRLLAEDDSAKDLNFRRLSGKRGGSGSKRRLFTGGLTRRLFTGGLTRLLEAEDLE